MDGTEVIILAGVVVLAFALRVLPSATKGHRGNDSYYHISIARALRRNRGFPENDTCMVPENAAGYPPLLHLILAPFAERRENIALRYLAPALDTLSVLVTYLLAGQLGLAHPVIPAAIVAMSPMAVLQGTSLSPRPLGSLALSVALVSGFTFWAEGTVWFLAAVMISETAVMLSHKMSFQTMLAAHTAVAIAATFYNPVRGAALMLALPGAFALAVVLTRGKYYTRTLKDHIGFVKAHMAHGDYATGKKGIPSPLRNLKSDPLSFAGPFLAIWMVLDIGLTEPLAFLLAWSAAVLGISSFWPWGDAWRHMAFGTIPSAVLAAMWIDTLGMEDVMAGILLALLLAALVAITVMQLRSTMAGDQAARLVSAMESLPQDWKDRLRGAPVYSNVIHYSLPYVLAVRCFGANPNASGMEVDFRIRQAGHKSLGTMAELAKELTGSELQYFMLFDGPPRPEETGFDTAYAGSGLRILVRAG